MTKFNEELARTFFNVLKEFLNASDREMEPYVREKIKEFVKEAHSPEEIYDFCDSISKLPCQRISEKACVGDISAFMQSVFDVTKYYEK